MPNIRTVGLMVYAEDAEAMRATLEKQGASAAGTLRLTDTYLRWPDSNGWQIVRRSPDGDTWLVRCASREGPGAVETVADAEVLRGGAEAEAKLIRDATASGAIVGRITRRRETWKAPRFDAHLDRLPHVGKVVGFEVTGARFASSLRERFDIRPADVLPWSCADLVAMHRRAKAQRRRLTATASPGRLLLLDGASGSGKTTIARMLTHAEASPGGPALVPRFSTRRPRPGQDVGEYVFVRPERFRTAAARGDFVEYRDFLYGMSYGLPWRHAIRPLLEGRDAVGIIDYGNAAHVRRILPEAVIVLVEASPETLRARLGQRGTNTPEQIEERLANAVSLASRPAVYDLVVSNENGELNRAVTRVRRFLAGPPSPGEPA